MRNMFTGALVAGLTMTSFPLQAKDDAVFIRDAFSGAGQAGYRWANGWSLSGRAADVQDDYATGDHSLTQLTLVVGKRNTLNETDNWHSFWDADLGYSYLDIDGDKLSGIELGAFIGAEVYLAPRLSLAARIGAIYTDHELSATADRQALDLGRAKVELNYYW